MMSLISPVKPFGAAIPAMKPLDVRAAATRDRQIAIPASPFRQGAG